MNDHVRQSLRLAGRPALMLGVRTALATAVPLAAAPLIGGSAAVWAALAGYVVALADKGGSYRTRASTMGGVTLAAGAAALFGALAGAHAALAVPLMLVVATLCGFAGVLGPAGAAGGTAVAVQLAVGLALPAASPQAALMRAVDFVAGGAAAMVLALLFWPVRVYKPARYAVGRVYRALAANARAMSELLSDAGGAAWCDRVMRDHKGVRETIEAARAVLAATRRGRPGESGRGARLLVLLEAGDQLFGTLAALAAVIEAAPPPTGERAALDALAATLDELAGRIESERRLPPTPTLPAALAPEPLVAADAHAAVLVARLRSYVELAYETVATLYDDSAPRPTPSLPLIASAPLRLGERVRQNLGPDSPLFRHALRLGVTTAVAVAVTRALALPRGYWVTVTVLVLLQPYAPATFVKALQRVGGTVAGAILAALLLTTLRSHEALLAIVAVLAGLSGAVLQVNYALFAFFLTPTFVLIADANAHDWHLAELRIVNTLLGGALALASSRLLWRKRERFVDAMAAALTALGAYVTGALTVVARAEPLPSPSLPPLRRDLGLCMNEADAAFDRLLADGAPAHASVEAAMTLLLYARRLGATVGATASLRELAPATTTDARAPLASPALLQELAAAVATALAELAASLREGRAPAPLPPFEPRLRPFSGSLVGAQLQRLVHQLTVLQQAAARWHEHARPALAA